MLLLVPFSVAVFSLLSLDYSGELISPKKGNCSTKLCLYLLWLRWRFLCSVSSCCCTWWSFRLIEHLTLTTRYVFPLPHASHQIGRVGTNPYCKTLSVALHSRQWSACWINQPVVLMSLVRWNRLVDKITLGRSPPLHCPL